MKEKLNANQALDILNRVDSHDRTDKLVKIINQLDDEARKKALLFTWMNTQAPSRDWDFWYMNLDYAPITDDQAAFDALPEGLTIYRGAGCEKSAANGFSWTMDREIAVKFAKLQTRPIGSGMIPRKEPGFIATRNILKEQISMFVTERKESEVVILPDDTDFPVGEATIERVES